MGYGKMGHLFTAREISSLVKDDLARVEQEISAESFASVEAVTNVGRYLQSNGGKRLRPMLLLLSCRLFGSASDSAVRMAAVVEMIHTATLVHDDVIDLSEMRRGKPSPNVVWGNQTSVLAGDWLYMQAFQIALRERNFHVLDLLIGLTQLMVEGELLQLERIGRADLTEADYMELVDRKTASLFSACAKLGAVMGNADKESEARMGEYAWNLGIAFQMVDDILDFTSREQILGKPVGNDLREGKLTLPLIYGLQSATPSETEMIGRVLRERSYDNVPFPNVLNFLQRTAGIARAQERVHVFADRARTLIQEFPDSPYQRALLGLTELVADRDR